MCAVVMVRLIVPVSWLMLSQIPGGTGKGGVTGHDVALVSAAAPPAQMLNEGRGGPSRSGGRSCPDTKTVSVKVLGAVVGHLQEVA